MKRWTAGKLTFRAIEAINLDPRAKVIHPTEQLAYENIFGSWHERAQRQAAIESARKHTHYRRLSRDPAAKVSLAMPYPEMSVQADYLQSTANRLESSSLFLVMAPNNQEVVSYIASKYGARAQRNQAQCRLHTQQECRALLWYLANERNWVMDYWRDQDQDKGPNQDWHESIVSGTNHHHQAQELTEGMNENRLLLLFPTINELARRMKRILKHSNDELAVVSAVASNHMDGTLDDVMSIIQEPWKAHTKDAFKTELAAALRHLAGLGLTEARVGLKNRLLLTEELS